MTILSDGGRYEMKNSAHTPISKPHVPDAYQAYIAKRRECEETNPLLVTKSKNVFEKGSCGGWGAPWAAAWSGC